MKRRGNSYVYLGPLMSMCLTVSLVACQPPRRNSTQADQIQADITQVGLPRADISPVKISSLSEKGASCEAKLRKQMDEKTIGLFNVRAIETEITAANRMMVQTNSTIYSVRQKKEISSIGVAHSGQAPSAVRVTFNLSKSSEDAATEMNLAIKIETHQPQIVTEIQQRFNVTQACELILTLTDVKTIKHLEGSHYTYAGSSYYSNGETQSESDNFTIPENTKLTNFMPEVRSFNDLNSGLVSYDKQSGLVTVVLRKKNLRAFREFGLDLVLESQEMELVQDGKKILVAQIGADKGKGIRVAEVLRLRSWELPKAIWRGLTLGSSRDVDQLAGSELSKEYLKSHNMIRVTTDDELAYEHFEAYWKILTIAVDEKSKKKTYMLLENETASYHDSAKPADLISNETIQTHLPQIQSIASRILTQTSDRREQLRLILSTLKSNYRYDDEMIKNNVIRKLTTTEALARGQGVCQHYAVLFTAIARALKIPTRIVLGLSLINGRPSGHAWVESEVQLNQWQVIEPQNERGLETTQTRFYFPTSRALILEDKTHKTQDGILEIMKANYLFKEAQ